MRAGRASSQRPLHLLSASIVRTLYELKVYLELIPIVAETSHSEPERKTRTAMDGQRGLFLHTAEWPVYVRLMRRTISTKGFLLIVQPSIIASVKPPGRWDIHSRTFQQHAPLGLELVEPSRRTWESTACCGFLS